ncbi:hypothetical protein BH18ACT15_BH18ACT15_09370 [soil metagenome]
MGFVARPSGRLAELPGWIPGWLTPLVEKIEVTDLLRLAAVAVVALVATLLLRRAVRKVESKVAEKTTPLRALKRTQTLTKVLSGAGIVIIWALAATDVVRILGGDLGLLLASVGIVGLAVGFGAQSLVKDMFSGFFTLLEDQYGVGDTVAINGVASGVVETLTLRVTGIRDVEGTIHYFANGSIDWISNRSKEWARAVIDVGVGYRENPERVRAVLKNIAEDAKADPDLGGKLYATPEVWGIETLGEYEVVWRMVAETKPARQWDVARQLRERVKVAFDAAGVEMPFPYRVMVHAENGRGPVGTRESAP